MFLTNVLILLVYILHIRTVSRDSSVGIATGYGLNNQGAGVRVPVG
jgi:hypothetical protein